MRHTHVMPSALLALTLFSSAAHGQAPLTKLWTGCGGNIFNTCASVELSIVGTTVTVRTLNLSGSAGSSTYAGTVFTGIGFDNLNIAAVYDVSQNGRLVAASTHMTGPVMSGTPNSWIARNDRQIGGGINLDMVGTTTNGVNDGIASDCAAAGQLPAQKAFWASFSGCGGAYAIANSAVNGGWVSFTFTIQPHSLTQTDVDNATLLVKGQNGPNGNSTEFICAPGQCVPPPPPPPPGVVPEPATLVLLGTGLLGLGAKVRRRKSGAVTDNPL